DAVVAVRGRRWAVAVVHALHAGRLVAHVADRLRRIFAVAVHEADLALATIRVAQRGRGPAVRVLQAGHAPAVGRVASRRPRRATRVVRAAGTTREVLRRADRFCSGTIGVLDALDARVVTEEAARLGETAVHVLKAGHAAQRGRVTQRTLGARAIRVGLAADAVAGRRVADRETLGALAGRVRRTSRVTPVIRPTGRRRDAAIRVRGTRPTAAFDATRVGRGT